METDLDSSVRIPRRALRASQPLRIGVDEERNALALSTELAEIGAIDVRRNRIKWEVSVDCPKTHPSVVRALDAARRTLGPSDTALVLVDGHKYRVRGECLGR